MINEISNDAKARMEKSISALQAELAKLRTGRANPALLDQVSVDYYGNVTPLNQVASVTISDPRTLLVTPWDKSVVAAVEKAIINANLGLNPATAGESIRVPMPPLTEERRRDLVKVVKQEGENAKVAMRNIRRDANQSIKDLLKDKEITEDEARAGEEKIQKVTDSLVKEVDSLIAAKEKDLMEV